MRWLLRLQMKMRMLLDRGNAAARLDEELQFRLDQQIAENIASGMSLVEARCSHLHKFSLKGRTDFYCVTG